jgi:hypothetical protein
MARHTPTQPSCAGCVIEYRPREIVKSTVGARTRPMTRWRDVRIRLCRQPPSARLLTYHRTTIGP